MLTLPKVVRRKAVPYIYVRSTLRHRHIKRQFPVFAAELRDYLESIGVNSFGPPIMRFNRVHANGDHELEFGFVTKTPVPGNGPIRTGIVPAGDYVSVTWAGHFEKLPDINAMLNGWASSNGIEWARGGSGEENTYASKIELFYSSPEDLADPSRWRTEVAILINRIDASESDRS